MINRRSFLRLVRNRVAAGVLCSGMLTDALESSAAFPLAEVFPSELQMTATAALLQLRKADKLWHSQYMNDPTKFYGVGIAQQMDEFSREVADRARQRMEEHETT